MILGNKTQGKILVKNLEVAESFFQRGKGLLGRERLPEDQALWINPCNNIHTFFMKFSIDCVFLDKNLVVKRIYNHVSPWRLIGPVLKARSVIEMTAGSAAILGIKVGDQLYVGN